MENNKSAAEVVDRKEGFYWCVTKNGEEAVCRWDGKCWDYPGSDDVFMDEDFSEIYSDIITKKVKVSLPEERKEGFYHVKYDNEWTIGQYIVYTLYKKKHARWIVLNEDLYVSESEIEEIDERQICRS